MLNNFDTEVAKEVGVNAAVIYFNIKYWCEYNRTNDQNEYEGLYWTYNSISAFEKQFEYFSAKQIRTALSVLEEHGYIKSGNFNKSAYDRTKWYADLRFNSEDKPTLPEKKIHFDKRANGDDENGEPIPNINTNIKPNNKLIEKEIYKEREVVEKPKVFIPPTVEQVREYCLESGYGIDPEQFVDFYESKGWMIGKNKMKSWKAAVRTWVKNRKNTQPKSDNPYEDMLREEGYYDTPGSNYFIE